MPNVSPKWKLLIAVFLIEVLAVAIFYGYFRREIIALYQGQESIWTGVVEILYPRFFTEKYRFSVDFFLQRGEQVLWRVVAISWIAVGIYFFGQKKEFFEKFWQINTTYHRVKFLQIFLLAGWLYESLTWYKSLLRLSQASAFYEPHLLFKYLPFPSQAFLFWSFAVLYAFWLLSFLPKYGSIFWFLASVQVVVFQAFLYGFGKLDHTYATWTYTSLLLGFLLYEAEKAKKGNLVNAWALKLMQVVVASVYLQVGLEKLFISGLQWFAPETMQTHLLSHPTALGIWIAQYPILCTSLSVLALVWQLSFVLILFFPPLKMPILFGGVLFHTFTFILMNIGGFPSYWFLVYVIWFLELKKLPESQIREV